MLCLVSETTRKDSLALMKTLKTMGMHRFLDKSSFPPRAKSSKFLVDLIILLCLTKMGKFIARGVAGTESLATEGAPIVMPLCLW